MSVLPVSRLSHPPPPTGHSLQAVNNSSITTLGAESTPSTSGSGTPFGGCFSLQTSSTPFLGPTFCTTSSSWSMSPTTNLLTPSPNCQRYPFRPPSTRGPDLLLTDASSSAVSVVLEQLIDVVPTCVLLPEADSHTAEVQHL